jgi:hypothetical protein
VACGIAALLALERRDRAGDLAAMALLIVDLLFFALGIAFVAAATVELALSRERWRRAYIVVVPTVLWLLWYAGYGHDAHTFISFHNAANAPSYVLDGLASSLATLVGLGLALGDYQTGALDWGRPLLVLAVGLAGWRLYQLGRPSGRLLGVLVLLLGFWSLTALNTNPLAPATAGRYQYLGIVLMVLVAAELVRGMEVRRWAVIGIVLVAGASAFANVVRLRDAANGLAGIAQQQRGGLGALELTRGQVDSAFKLTEQNSGVDYLGALDAGSYFSAVDAYGSPAYTPAELATAPEAGRVAADKVFAAALGVSVAPDARARTTHCAASQPGTPIAVPHGGLLLRTQASGAQASLRRYATQSFPVSLGPLPPGEQQLLQITPDSSPRPWALELSGSQVQVCQPSGA